MRRNVRDFREARRILRDAVTRWPADAQFTTLLADLDRMESGAR